MEQKCYLCSVKFKQLKSELTNAGCYIIRNGSNHEIWYSPITGKKFPIGTHSGDVPMGLERKIREESGVRKKIDK